MELGQHLESFRKIVVVGLKRSVRIFVMMMIAMPGAVLLTAVTAPTVTNSVELYIHIMNKNSKPISINSFH
jgi:hypothetical protein